MRTTLTLDPDVVQLLKEEEHRQRKSFKEVVNEAIRRGLAPQAKTHARRPYRVHPHKTTLRPGIDAAGFNRLADEMAHAIEHGGELQAGNEIGDSLDWFIGSWPDERPRELEAAISDEAPDA